MKIAILGTRGIPNRYGGFEAFAEKLSLRLVENGHQVSVYCRRPFTRPEDDQLVDPRIKRVILPTISAMHLDTPIHTLLSALHVVFTDAEVVLLCNVGNSPVAWIPRLFGKPVVLNVDGLDRQRKKWGWFARTYLHFCEWLSVHTPTRTVTDSNAMQAIRLAFKYLPIAYEHPHDEEARTMMHNAASIAAIAFSNASVGVNHALAHSFGARFRIPHGRANALVLPHVIAYNAGVPAKFMPSPNQGGYIAHRKYALIAELLDLGGNTIEEKVQSLIAAVEQLLDRVAMPRSIAAMGISKEDFERAIPDLVKIAYDDPSWLSNPRMPLVRELEELFWTAYHGRSQAKAASAQQQTA